MTKKAKTVGVAGLLAVLAIAIGLGWVSDWYRNWNLKSWFNYWGKGPTVVKPAEQSDVPGAGLIVSEIQNSSVMTLNAVRSVDIDSPGSDEASYTLSVTYTPIGIVSPELAWTIAWSETESEWAKDKSIDEYLTIEPSGENTAIVNCLQAFGQQAIVTVAFVEDASVFARCTVDYKLKLLDSLLPNSKIGFDLSKYYGTVFTTDKVAIMPVSSVRSGLPSQLFMSSCNQFLINNISSFSNTYSIMPTEPVTVNVYAQTNPVFGNVFSLGDYASDFQQFYQSIGKTFSNSYYYEKNPVFMSESVATRFTPKIISSVKGTTDNFISKSAQRICAISIYEFMDKLFPANEGERGFVSADGQVDDYSNLFIDEYFYFVSRYFETYSDNLTAEDFWNFKVIVEIEFDGVVHKYEKKAAIKYNYPVTISLNASEVVF